METRLKHVLGLKFLGYILDELVTYCDYCCRKVGIGRKVAGSVRSLVNDS